MVFYFVQPGETLYAIAKRYQTTVHALVVANRLEDPNAICPGQALVIPRPGEVSSPPGGIVHRVRAGETIFHLAARFDATVAAIMAANQVAHPEFILPGQQVVIPERSVTGHEWPQQGRSAARSGVASLHLAGPPKEAWGLYPGRSDRAQPSTPVIRYEHIFVGLGDGAYYCVEPAAGRVIWRLPMALPDGAVVNMAAPVVFDGLIYLCTPGGQVMAAEALTGHKIWQVALERPVGGLAPAVHDGLLYLADRAGTVQALELKTGARVWATHIDEELPWPLAAGDDAIYVTTQAGNLYALCGQDGEILWHRLAAAVEGAIAPPVFAELLVLVGGRAFDPHTGEPLWETDAAGDWSQTPLVLTDRLLHGRGALDLFTGKSHWQLSREQVPPVAHLTGTVSHVLGIAKRKLLAWRTENGVLAWTCDLGAAPAGQPALAPGMMALTMVGGGMKLFRLSEAP